MQACNLAGPPSTTLGLLSPLVPLTYQFPFFFDCEGFRRRNRTES
uniref:Uncharacterized protein n=1 Tax=Rhizophora mucronata TaxID=61149 RepID=A0A2P2LWH3_RHIMU